MIKNAVKNAKIGKISRMPLSIREELCIRLLNGEPGSMILPWLNALPEAIAILKQQFNGDSVSHGNLSQFRKGGWQEWLSRHERLQYIRDLAQYAAELSSKSKTSLAEAGLTIASSRIFKQLEALGTGGKADVDILSTLVSSLSLIRAAEMSKARLQIDKARLKQKDRELDLEQNKYQRTTCELFLKWYEKGEARNIVAGDGDNSEKIEQLGRIMFGDLWDVEEKDAM